MTTIMEIYQASTLTDDISTDTTHINSIFSDKCKLIHLFISYLVNYFNIYQCFFVLDAKQYFQNDLKKTPFMLKLKSCHIILYNILNPIGILEGMGAVKCV